MLILLPSLRNGCKNAATRGGRWCTPTTLSRTTLSGHGAATLIAVCASIATKIAAKLARYGRNKLVIKENIRIVPRSQLPNEGGAPLMMGRSLTQSAVRCPTARTLFAYGAK